MGFIIGVLVIYTFIILIAVAVLVVLVDLLRRIIMRKKLSVRYTILVIFVGISAALILYPFLTTGGLESMLRTFNLI